MLIEISTNIFTPIDKVAKIATNDFMESLLKKNNKRLSSYSNEKIFWDDEQKEVVIKGVHRDCGSRDNSYDEDYQKIIQTSPEDKELLHALFVIEKIK